jgi:hypothetical protein
MINSHLLWLLNTLNDNIHNITWSTFKVVLDKEEYKNTEIPKHSHYLKIAGHNSKMYFIYSNPGYIMFTNGPFNNDFPCIITYKEKIFFSVTQLLMYIKATNKKYYINDSEEVVNKNIEIADKIINCRCPMKLYKFEEELQINNYKWNRDWFRILTECIILKFTQNKHLYDLIYEIYLAGFNIVAGTSCVNGCGFKYDHTNPKHNDPKNWTGKMILTKIYKKVMKVMF